MYTIVGLGNPGEEYKNTRHNTGRIILESLHDALDFSAWKVDGKIKALTADGVLGKEKVKFVMPETFMNKSGQSVASIKKPEQLVVIYDDLDLPLGKMKISFNRSSGGHKGLESIIRALKTEAFVRIRVGISPTTASGKIKKPSGNAVVGDFILAPFKNSEMAELKKISKRALEAVMMLASSGSSAKAMRLSREKAMGEFNGN